MRLNTPPLRLLLTLLLLATSFAISAPVAPQAGANADSSHTALLQQAPADYISFVTDILPQRQRDLWVMRVDGTDKKQITSGFNVWFASWSPEGERIAVTTESGQLIVLNRDGTGQRLLTNGAYSPPFWSPDGHFIAYVGGEKFGTPIARGNLRIIPAGGGASWLVPGGEDIPSLPPGAAAVAWSPDGTRIATGWPGRILHIAGGPGSEVGIEALKGAGAGKFVVAGGWAPDGRHLAVTDGIEYGILDMPTGEFVSIARSFRQPGIARPGVSWSGGLRKVAFAINSAQGDGNRLFLADFDGRNAKLILSHPDQGVWRGQVSDYGPPFFSADNRTMLMRVSRTTAQGGNLIYTHESWLVRTDGSGGEKLLDGFNATWKPKPRLQLPDSAFWFQWRVPDLPVANGQAQRSWLWGPTAIYSGTERIQNARPIEGGGVAHTGLIYEAVYFDKGRMEIVDKNPARPTKYLVTAGALAQELVTATIPRGVGNSLNRALDKGQAPDIMIAGDNPNADAPTYATFNKLGAGTDAGKAQDRTGQAVEQTLARDGTVRQNPALGGQAKIAAFIRESGHNLPDVFLNYFRAQTWDWIYIAGYPISEPYWARVDVGGQPRDVLVQIFERRTVTFDPAAPEGYKVQFGNVGRHYYDWRYAGR